MFWVWDHGVGLTNSSAGRQMAWQGRGRGWYCCGEDVMPYKKERVKAWVGMEAMAIARRPAGREMARREKCVGARCCHSGVSE